MYINALIGLIDKIHLGTPTSFRELSVFPVLPNQYCTALTYLSMKAAIEQKKLQLSEVNDTGAVSKIKATNLSTLPVLLLDGESIIGAKQNRIINTTILLAPKTEIFIPVSCTEKGRWKPENNLVFSASEDIMPAKSRYKKSQRVYQSLQAKQGFSTDQREIWNEVDRLNAFHKVVSITHSMQDAFKQKESSLNKYLEVFKIQENQTGIMVFRSGQLAGLDYVSIPSMYRDLHMKLLKSHAMDSITNQQVITPEQHDVVDAANLLKNLTDQSFTKYKAIGLGEDYRFNGEKYNATLLTYNEEAIHWTAFPK